MFKKVFKRDFKAIRDIWWIVAVSALALTVVGALVMRLCLEAVSSEDASVGGMLLSSLGIIGGGICFVAVIASIGVTWLLAHYHFYKNFYTDEGYLTFTLPVSRKTLHLSKTVNSVLWQTAHILLLLLCVLIAAVIFIVGAQTGESVGGSVGIFESLGISFGGWGVLYIVLLAIATVVSLALSTCLVQLCITVGAVIAQKHKLLVSIGIYYLVGGVFSTVSQIGMFLGGGELVAKLFELIVIGDGLSHFTVLVMLLWLVAGMATLTVALFLAVQHLIDRKLNLA